MIGPRPVRFDSSALPPESLEQPLANDAVSSAIEAAAIVALGTNFKAIADTPGSRREQQHTCAGAGVNIHGLSGRV
ncbi:hypothetical protein GCM10011591_26780 [Nocardia camponoti]|uniref:Uncharacterized protein n=1 Tax=Nocardia camponoti TaxID=1616106 RepID=A0A917QJG5_9NOCA|nr:hypothetical protein GCM10011591_26780 [Nocardia camponoti]